MSSSYSLLSPSVIMIRSTIDKVGADLSWVAYETYKFVENKREARRDDSKLSKV